MPANLLRLFSLLSVPPAHQASAKPSEDSLLFRVLVQALVSIGIIATDVAAETQMSWWAVPLSMIGATWSWRQRHRPQVALKFGLAAALLLALFTFFQHLLGSLNDTRMVLAELLVQVQTIHTFDMPRRKDLGYSIIIGVILVAVAATIGQTMAFAPMLLLFLCFALPVMLLDYRSRLGMAPAGLAVISRRTASAENAALPIRNLAKLLGIVLLLGLVVFAVMPRLPSYQVQTMPMSGEMPSTNFDGSKIANPGYQNKGKGKAGKLIGGSSGQAGEAEAEEFDDSSYYGFNQRINQNLRGQMKPKLVLRVRSQSPGFWRVLAFDRYTGQGWEISQNDQAKTITRETWASKFTLPRLSTLAPTKKIIQSYTAVSELPNVLPALTVPSEVYFPSQKIAVDREGSLRAAAGLSSGFTYTVASEVRERDATALAKAGFRYEPNFRMVMADYLQVPSNIAKKLNFFTEKIIADYPKEHITQNAEPLDNNYDVALYLAQYLKQHYEVPKNFMPPLPEGQDLVTWFLGDCPDRTCGGYPDHFATVLTMMLRSVNIPARLAVGFAPGSFNPFTGMYEVQNTDAHAVTEVYFPKYGWYSFDPLPGHPLFPPSIEEDQTFGVVKQIWNWVAGLVPSPVSAWLGTIMGYVAGVIGLLWVFFSQSWLGAICGLATAIGVAFAGWLLWKNWRRWRYERWLKQQPPMERIYLQMLASLPRWSIAPKVPSQTPLEHWESIGEPVLIREAVEPIVLAYVAWRYGDQAPHLKHLQSILRNLQKSRA